MTTETTTTSLRSEEGMAILNMHGKGVFNPSSLRDFNTLLDRVESDESQRALFITGEDKNFSQGLDLEYLLAIPQDDFAQFVENTMVMAVRLLTFPIPVVAVVNGHAFGLGAMLALASDFRVMRADRGFICLPEIDLKMSFTPAMNALVVNKLDGRLRRDMMLTGHRVGGEEGVARGLLDACGAEHELMDLAKQVVGPALDKDRKSMFEIKRDLNAPIISVVEAGIGVRGD